MRKQEILGPRTSFAVPSPTGDTCTGPRGEGTYGTTPGPQRLWAPPPPGRSERSEGVLGTTEVLGFIDFLDFKDFLGFPFIIDFLGFPGISMRNSVRILI